ncbi:hypothetical protein OAB10_04665 [Candidatus Pelagibacter sp.]|nr:hypothetical protein [Candidatus Pelagibacter sp.]
MKNLKILILSLIFLISNYFAAYSDITASSPTNMIQRIASTSSFTSLDQNTAQAASEIQNVTDTLLDGEQLRETVELEAEIFGSQLNETEGSNEEQLVTLNSSKELELEFPEPNLDTIVYDTGLMTLSVNESAQYNGGAGDDTNIFSGDQKARVRVYIDFKRQKQWGSIESHITLTNENGGKKMVNVTEGGAATVTELPVTNQQLTRVISSATTKTLNIGATIPTFANDEEPYLYDKHTINSLLQDNTTPTLGVYLGDNPKTTQSADFADLHKSVAHGTGGDKGVLVGAKFSTAAGGTLGTSTASFEVSNVGACASADGCTLASGSNEIGTVITSIVRLDATATTKATKYTGD